MLITRISTLTGIVHTLDLPITPLEYERYLRDKSRPLIQDLFPNLTPDEREFLLTGITSAEWEEAFGPSDTPAPSVSPVQTPNTTQQA